MHGHVLHVQASEGDEEESDDEAPIISKAKRAKKQVQKI